MPEKIRIKLVPKIQTAADYWERVSAVPLGVLGLVYLALYSLEVIYAGAPIASAAVIGSAIIWAIFAFDLVAHMFSATSVRGFFLTNWLEIATLVLPFIRILRVFRSVMALRVMRGLVTDRLHATGFYLIMLLPMVWFSGAVSVLEAENSSPDASITNIRDALWWSLTTIATVGYGDIYPTTFDGKLVAAALMISGIALFSASAGMFASWINGSAKKQLSLPSHAKQKL